MTDNNLFKEYLTRQYSGYVPTLPADDWVKLQGKMKKKLRKTKRFLSILNLSLTSAFLILGFWNYSGFGVLNSNDLLNNNSIIHKNVKINSSYNQIKSISESQKKSSTHNLNNNSTQHIDKQAITSNSLLLPADLNTVKQKVISGNKNSIYENKVVNSNNDVSINNNLKSNEKENTVISGNIENSGVIEKPAAVQEQMKKEVLLLNSLSSVKFIPDKVTARVSSQHLKSLFHSPLILVKLVFSPSYTFSTYKISKGSDSLIHENYKSIRDNSEKGGFSLSEGINIECHLNKRLSVTSGLIYNSYRINGNYDFYNNKIPVIDSASKKIVGYITVKDTVGTHFKTENKYNFIEVPVIVTYRLFKINKLSFDLKSGGNFMYLLSAKEEVLNPVKLKPQDNSDDHFNKTNWSIMAGLSCTYDFNGIFSIGLEPVWRKVMDPLYKKDEIINLYPWSVSMNLSLILKF